MFVIIKMIRFISYLKQARNFISSLSFPTLSQRPQIVRFAVIMNDTNDQVHLDQNLKPNSFLSSSTCGVLELLVTFLRLSCTNLGSISSWLINGTPSGPKPTLTSRACFLQIPARRDTWSMGVPGFSPATNTKQEAWLESGFCSQARKCPPNLCPSTRNSYFSLIRYSQARYIQDCWSFCSQANPSQFVSSISNNLCLSMQAHEYLSTRKGSHTKSLMLRLEDEMPIILANMKAWANSF